MIVALYLESYGRMHFEDYIDDAVAHEVHSQVGGSTHSVGLSHVLLGNEEKIRWQSIFELQHSGIWTNQDGDKVRMNSVARLLCGRKPNYCSRPRWLYSSLNRLRVYTHMSICSILPY